MDGILVCLLIFLLTLLLWYYLSTKNGREGRGRAKIPPGSMGWPYIGDTHKLYSRDPNAFFATKQKRYGEIFKTRVLGCACVMLASPEAARFVLVTNAHLFKPTYPKSKERLIGRSALFFHEGELHVRLRKLVQNSLSLDAIRSLVADIEAAAVSLLDSWDNAPVINTYNELKQFSFEVGVLAIFGHLETHYKEELKKNYFLVNNGYNCLPNNIPGTLYRKALLARRRLDEIINRIITERKNKESTGRDLLACMLNLQRKGELTHDQIADNIIGVLFAAQDTTASAMTWLVKYLHDHPQVLQCVKDEQLAIRAANQEANQPLSWSQTRQMPFTSKVILETLRMASVISFPFREAVTDVEYKGYLIPKGWKVMPLFRSIHNNPEFFTDPDKFIPSRFEAAPKPNTFLPFGTGVHACPGNELAKLEMLIVTHHLVTGFRWEVKESRSGIQYGPFPIPMDGLPTKFRKEPAII